MSELESALQAKIRSIPDYPKKGILFRDITPLLQDPKTFGACADAIAGKFSGDRPDSVAGIEARGFLIGIAVAERLGVGFVPIRKKGKLPYRKISVDYELEYNKETMEMHEDAISKGNNVLIVDDLLATGGTAAAAAELVKKAGGTVVGYAFIVELSELKGRLRLNGARIVSLMTC